MAILKVLSYALLFMFIDHGDINERKLEKNGFLDLFSQHFPTIFLDKYLFLHVYKLQPITF